MFERESGVLLHPSSLPSPYGIGDFGPDALRWVKWLTQSEQRLWQVLPLSPVGSGLSPYTCTSSFGGNALLLSPERLHQRGYLSAQELADAQLPHGRLQADQLRRHKLPLLQRAAQRFVEQARGEQRDQFEDFKRTHADWLLDFARYEALKATRGGDSWLSWPREIRQRNAEALARLDAELQEQMELAQALQFLFEDQWQSVRRLANLKRIRVIGDLPIFVALDSADVWAHQHLFQLTPEGEPTAVAGVPPDYFAKDGQRWGNPLYRWSAHEEDGFAWWIRRVSRTLELTDILRIDHFRGFAACWEIPADEPTAVNGRWVPAPGKALFEHVRAALGDELPIIAEDLGIITDDVVALREHFGFPTMRVLQFSFAGPEKLLPHNYPDNCVAYTGTHDNDTTVGWYAAQGEEGGLSSPEALEAERDSFRRYYATDGTNVHWTGIQRLMAGNTKAVLFPLQDVMGLGSEARMNTPGTVGDHNWTWRFDWNQLTPTMTETLRQITQETGRNRA